MWWDGLKERDFPGSDELFRGGYSESSAHILSLGPVWQWKVQNKKLWTFNQTHSERVCLLFFSIGVPLVRLLGRDSNLGERLLCASSHLDPPI